MLSLNQFFYSCVGVIFVSFSFWLMLFANWILLCVHRVHPLRRELADWPSTQNAKVVEGCLAHYLHVTNTGAVTCYAERRVVHCRMRLNVSAAPRPNMSTAALERRPAKRTRGGGQSKHILHILLIMHIGHIATISKLAYTLVGPGARFEIVYFKYFKYFK